MSLLLRIALPLLILGAGWFGYSRLSVEGEKEKRPPREERVIRTEVQKLERVDFRTVVRTQGTVRPENEAVLSAQVSGKVIQVSESLQDGAFFEKDEILVELAAEDFEAAIIRAQADLARAESAHAQEETKARQARLNWEDLGYEEEPNDLVLRLPQLREAEANVLAAKAALASSERDLDRVQVRAPFTGRVLLRTVAEGQMISPSATLATIFRTDIAEVRLPISPRDMAFLDLPEIETDTPLPVRLRDALQPDASTVWAGLITGTEGALDVDSRELFAIARIEDPFGIRSGLPPLRIGQPVVAEIDALVLEGVFVIPREAVQELDTITLVDPESLTISRHKITPIWSDKERLVVRDGEIEDGALLSTSRLVYAPEGAKVEILPAQAEDAVTSLPEETDEKTGGG